VLTYEQISYTQAISDGDQVKSLCLETIFYIYQDIYLNIVHIIDILIFIEDFVVFKHKNTPNIVD